MSILGDLANLATGGLGKTIMDVAKTWFPPDMSEGDRLQAELAFANVELERKRLVEQSADEAERNLTNRIKELEGTASDLKTIPIIGPLVIFLRGLQRPVWGFATLYMDFMVFSAKWDLTETNETALLVINFLVLGFLFGERTVKNVMPLVTQYMKTKAGK